MRLLLISILFIITGYSKIIDMDKILNNNKQVMVFFYMQHCPWCHKMMRESLRVEDIQKINRYFFYIDIDVEDNSKIIYNKQMISKIDFAKKFNIYFYPTTLFFENGKKIYNIKGYQNKVKFRYTTKYIDSKSYKTMDINEFITNENFINN